MRIKNVSSKLALGTMILSFIAPACSPAVFATKTPAITNTGSLVTWKRTGGIAGICQQLVIQNDRTFTAEDCQQEETRGQGQIDEADWNQLFAWQQEFQSFEWNVELPPGSADMYNDAYRFSGTGPQRPSPDQQEEINLFLADLFARLSEGN